MITVAQRNVFEKQIASRQTRIDLDLFCEERRAFLTDPENAELADIVRQAYDRLGKDAEEEQNAAAEAQEEVQKHLPPLSLARVLVILPSILGGIYTANVEVLRKAYRVAKEGDLDGILEVLEAIPTDQKLYGRIKFFFDLMAEKIMAVLISYIATEGERVEFPKVGLRALQRMIMAGRLPEEIAGDPRVNLAQLRTEAKPASALLAILQARPERQGFKPYHKEVMRPGKTARQKACRPNAESERRARQLARSQPCQPKKKKG